MVRDRVFVALAPQLAEQLLQLVQADILQLMGHGVPPHRVVSSLGPQAVPLLAEGVVVFLERVMMPPPQDELQELQADQSDCTQGTGHATIGQAVVSVVFSQGKPPLKGCMIMPRLKRRWSEIVDEKSR